MTSADDVCVVLESKRSSSASAPDGRGRAYDTPFARANLSGSVNSKMEREDCLGEGGCRRTADWEVPDQAAGGSDKGRNRPKNGDDEGAPQAGNWREGLGGRRCCQRAVWVQRAMRRGRNCGLAPGWNDLAHGRLAHGTVVRSMTAAAGRQARVVGVSEQGREWADGEEEGEEDGEGAPHLHRWYTRSYRRRKGDFTVRYHRVRTHEKERWDRRRVLP